MTDIVAIHPDRVEHLAGAVGRAATSLEATLVDLRRAALPAGSALTATGSLAQIVAWLDGEERALRWLVAEVRSWSGQVPPGLPVTVWEGPGHPSFGDPGAAHHAGLAAAAAIADGDRRAAADLIDEWGRDPVFTATLLTELGPEGIVAALEAADELWLAPDPHGPSHRRLAAGLAIVVATASHHPGTGPSVADLARAADRTGRPRKLLGLLFVDEAPFSTTFLVDAVRHVVLPINRAVAGAGRSVDAYRVAGLRDARALVLHAVAADLEASRRALAAADLDLLLAADLGYMDAGRAVGELLVAGTAPRTLAGVRMDAPLVTGQVADLGLAASNLRRGVEWVGSAEHLAPGVQHSLGAVARPWIGSFRSAGLDAAVAMHVDLEEDAARAFLRRAFAWAESGRQIEEAAWRWATAEVGRLAGDASLGAAGFDAVGSVLGIVSIARHDAQVAAAATVDERSDAVRRLWEDLTVGALRRVNPWLPALTGRPVDAAFDGLLPGRLELTHWREVRDEAIGAEYLALDYLVVSELWRRRAVNHYFDGPARQPPPSLIVGPASAPAIRPLAGLSEEATADYLRWRSALAAERPGPMQAAGERFLAEGRES